mmetsp:Transcript_26207/g.56167  ORF Transcript_26207/g.56167 Transcript_26207/m.56167 type:complete len:398 (-) Transcript_26207:794-1987(-)
MRCRCRRCLFPLGHQVLPDGEQGRDTHTGSDDHDVLVLEVVHRRRAVRAPDLDGDRCLCLLEVKRVGVVEEGPGPPARVFDVKGDPSFVVASVVVVAASVVLVLVVVLATATATATATVINEHFVLVGRTGNGEGVPLGAGDRKEPQLGVLAGGVVEAGRAFQDQFRDLMLPLAAGVAVPVGLPALDDGRAHVSPAQGHVREIEQHRQQGRAREPGTAAAGPVQQQQGVGGGDPPHVHEPEPAKAGGGAPKGLAGGEGKDGKDGQQERAGDQQLRGGKAVAHGPEAEPGLERDGSCGVVEHLRDGVHHAAGDQDGGGHDAVVPGHHVVRQNGDGDHGSHVRPDPRPGVLAGRQQHQGAVERHQAAPGAGDRQRHPQRVVGGDKAARFRELVGAVRRC